MKQIIFNLGFMSMAFVLLFGCQKEKLIGGGEIARETRMLTSFNSVEISGNRKAKLVYAAASKVEIYGYENLVAAMRSEIKSGKLFFEFPANVRVKNDNITLVIYTPNLEEVVLSGDTEMDLGAGFTGDKFNIYTSGNAVVKCSASAYNSLSIVTSGTASILAEPLVSKAAEVVVSGKAFVEVRATETLKVNISGEGEVHHWGNPAVNSTISGNGKLVKH